MFVGRVSPFDTKDKREIPEAVRIPNLFTDLVPSPFLLHQQFRVVSAVPSEALFSGTRVQRKQYNARIKKLAAEPGSQHKASCSASPLRMMLGNQSVIFATLSIHALGLYYADNCCSDSWPTPVKMLRVSAS